MEKIQAIKGIKDILPPEIGIWHHVFLTAGEIFRTFGYEEILIPIFEETRLFARGIGETTDIVEKEMYTFEDRGGKSLTLRPEGTASVVRAFIEHNLHLSTPNPKYYYIGPMFRRERPQAGRYRQFYQIGAEAFGGAHPAIDAEVIVLIHTLIETLKIGNIELQVNSLGCPACRPAYRKALQEFLQDKRASLCSECQRRIDLNPLRVLDCKVPSCKAIVADAPRTIDSLCEACSTHHWGLLGHLRAMNVPFIENPSIVRGLDYYSRTVFEFLGTTLGAQNAVAAGGRYDGLVEELGGSATPAVGFSLGVERLVSLIDPATVPRPPVLLFIAALGPEAQNEAFVLLHGLRREGIAAAMDYDGGSLKSQMRKADRLQAHYTLILGENELQQGKIVLRDMTQKTQETLDIAGLVEQLRQKLQSDGL
jgi:histidyl-tRNA synthetase